MRGQLKLAMSGLSRVLGRDSNSSRKYQIIAHMQHVDPKNGHYFPAVVEWRRISKERSLKDTELDRDNQQEDEWLKKALTINWFLESYKVKDTRYVRRQIKEGVLDYLRSADLSDGKIRGVCDNLHLLMNSTELHDRLYDYVDDVLKAMIDLQINGSKLTNNGEDSIITSSLFLTNLIRHAGSNYNVSDGVEWLLGQRNGSYIWECLSESGSSKSVIEPTFRAMEALFWASWYSDGIHREAVLSTYRWMLGILDERYLVKSDNESINDVDMTLICCDAMRASQLWWR